MVLKGAVRGPRSGQVAKTGGLNSGHARSREFMADEVERRQQDFDWTARSAGLVHWPLVILCSDNGLASGTDARASLARAIEGS